MTKGSSLSTILTSAAIFIALEIAALAMLSRSSTLQNIWLNRASHRAMATLWGGGEKLKNVFTMEKRMNALAEENFQLQQQLRGILQIESDVAEASVGPVSTDSTFRYIPATIVRISKNTAHNYIILNKGYADGVKPQSGIISSKGVIGIISAVDEHYSYGLTLMNTNISLSGRVKNTDFLAPVVWDGIHDNGAVLKDLPIHHEVASGDTIVTSGFSSIFPPDIPVGIAGAGTIVDGSLQNISITLFQEFSTVKYATIVENLDREAIDSIAEKGEGMQ